MRHISQTLALTTVVAFLAIRDNAAAAPIVVPSANAATEGNGNNGFPFNVANFSLTSQRYQQVFSASEFSGPVLITSVSFRPDADTGDPFSSTLSNVQIDLSTTSAAVDGLSTTFASNVGADNTIVFNGPLSTSSSDTGPAGGPKDFDILITFTTPFSYDPASGNLLFDVRNFGGGGTTQIDASESGSDTVSRVFTLGLGNSVNDATGVADSIGLIAQFNVESAAAVPEPASLAVWTMLLLSVAGACFVRKRKTAAPVLN